MRRNLDGSCLAPQVHSCRFPLSFKCLLLLLYITAPLLHFFFFWLSTNSSSSSSSSSSRRRRSVFRTTTWFPHLSRMMPCVVLHLLAAAFWQAARPTSPEMARRETKHLAHPEHACRQPWPKQMGSPSARDCGRPIQGNSIRRSPPNRRTSRFLAPWQLPATPSYTAGTPSFSALGHFATEMPRSVGILKSDGADFEVFAKRKNEK